MIHFADLHLHPFKEHSHNVGGKVNSRLEWGIKTLEWVSTLAYHDDAILTFSGDLIHDPESMRNSLFVNLLQAYDRYIERRGIDFYAISGNHDMSGYNGIEDRSSSYLQGLSIFRTFKLIDYRGVGLRNRANRIWGVPYLNNPKDTIKLIKDFNKSSDAGDILLIHSDLPGATTPMGIQTGDVDEYIDLAYWKKLTKKYQFVFAGHIHKHQRICENTYMIGAPIQKDSGEINTTPGVIESGSGSKIKFIPLPDTFPRFIRGERQNDSLNWYVPHPPKLTSEVTLENSGGYVINRKKLIKQYAKDTKLSSTKTKFLKTLLTKI